MEMWEAKIYEFDRTQSRISNWKQYYLFVSSIYFSKASFELTHFSRIGRVSILLAGTPYFMILIVPTSILWRSIRTRLRYSVTNLFIFRKSKRFLPIWIFHSKNILNSGRDKNHHGWNLIYKARKNNAILATLWYIVVIYQRVYFVKILFFGTQIESFNSQYSFSWISFVPISGQCVLAWEILKKKISLVDVIRSTKRRSDMNGVYKEEMSSVIYYFTQYLCKPNRFLIQTIISIQIFTTEYQVLNFFLVTSHLYTFYPINSSRSLRIFFLDQWGLFLYKSSLNWTN